MFKKFGIEPKRKAEIVRYIRRAGLILVPVIGLFFVVGVLAWTYRRQVLPIEGDLVTPEIEPNEVEPDYEVGPEVTPA
jgi:hypothetical protein